MNTRVLLFLAVCLPIFGCGPSEEKVQEDFEDFVSTRRDCSLDDDCAVKSFGCPLGCATVYNSEYEDEIQEEADRLLRKYERGGTSCDYDCAVAPEPVRAAGECSLE